MFKNFCPYQLWEPTYDERNTQEKHEPTEQSFFFNAVHATSQRSIARISSNFVKLNVTVFIIRTQCYYHVQI